MGDSFPSSSVPHIFFVRPIWDLLWYNITMIIPDKIKNKIEFTDTCWLWKGHINNSGYGRYNGKDFPDTYVHRGFFYLENGYLPKSPNIVGHLCEVRNCVNPKHLTNQTQSDNVRQYKNRIKSCPKGHEYDEKNTYLRKNGSRKCRECNRLNEARKRGQ